jgi:AcrR family transcriptional regulator
MGATAAIRCSAADRRRQIMEVAMQLFAQQGFQGTTTREIADRARVNEALIFRHFGSKEELYWAVIEDKCRTSGQEPLPEKRRRYDSDSDFFAALAEEMLRSRADDTTLSRLLLFTALENHHLSHRFFRTYVAEYFEKLAGYIRVGIQQGRFRAVDPLLAARSFLGMVVYHSWMQELFGYKRYQKIDNAEAGRVLADIWLRGMAPEEKSEAARAVKKSNNGTRRSRKNHAIV